MLYKPDLTRFSIMNEPFETQGVDVAGNPITFHHMHWWQQERSRTIYWRTDQWRQVEYEGETFFVSRSNLLASEWTGDSLEGIYYSVYEKMNPPYYFGGSHSTSFHRHDDPNTYGEYKTRRLPINLELLPSGKERSQRVSAWYDYLRERSKNIARFAFPEYASLEKPISDWYI